MCWFFPLSVSGSQSSKIFNLERKNFRANLHRRLEIFTVAELNQQ